MQPGNSPGTLKLRFQVVSVILPLAVAQAASALALPQPDAPVTHWPWWLRILAVIAVLAFVQIVARSMRRGAPSRESDSSSSDAGPLPR